MRRLGFVGLGLLGLALCAFLAATTFAPGTAVATWAPCPRNWEWVPAWTPRQSPLRAARFELRSASGTVHGKLCYGSPSLRGRVMIGGESVPFGQLWRTGANEPTTLHVDGPVLLGGLALAPGSYAIYTVPEPDEWQVIVNRSTRQWGLESEYTPEVASRELGRFALHAEALAAPVESLRFHSDPTPDGLALVLEWQTTRLRLPLAAAH